MTEFHAAVLGVVQGLTEFLPVSSSAHLILARFVFGWDADRLGLAFDVACHLGTLAAVFVYFRRELRAMAGGVPSMFRRRMGEASWLDWLIVAGTAPTVIVGFAFNDLIERTLRTPGVAAVTLAAGAVALLVAERTGSRVRDEASLTIPEAVGLGVAQAAALVPGVSRSAATIAVGIFLGLRRDAAARFSFLLGVPAILAAAGLEGIELAAHGMTTAAVRLFAIGMVTSAVIGYFTVKYFLRYLAGHSLDGFAWYRLALAAAVAAWILG